jgi:hypothetical protein
MLQFIGLIIIKVMWNYLISKISLTLFCKYYIMLAEVNKRRRIWKFQNL